MPRRTAYTSLRAISDINLTPLMDLTFILLITFIITFPLIEQGIPIDLPRADAAELTPDLAQTITVDHQGSLFLNDARIELPALNEEMLRLARIDSSLSVMVRADERVVYRRVVDVLKILHGAGIARMALVTQAEQGDAP